MASPRSLHALGLLDDPISTPLSYPGAIPAESGLLDGDTFLPLQPAELHDLDRRHQVLAVGSNAAPAQMLRKFTGRRVSTVLPMVRVRVHGLASGVSAHISRAGYVPATPIAAPGELHTMSVLWLDDEQLAALDDSEPNYLRVRLGAQFPVALPSGVRLDGCDVYVSRWGCLRDAHRQPLRLGDQRELLAAAHDAGL